MMSGKLANSVQRFAKAGILGWPVTHSRSPLIHGYWLKMHNLEGSYE